MNSLSLSTPAKLLFPFLFFSQYVAAFFAAFRAEPSSFFNVLVSLASYWIIAWWLSEDSRQRGVKWPMDMGMFVYLAWVVFIPYYLFRTRGLRALVGILCFAGMMIAGWIAAAITVAFFWY